MNDPHRSYLLFLAFCVLYALLNALGYLLAMLWLPPIAQVTRMPPLALTAVIAVLSVFNPSLLAPTGLLLLLLAPVIPFVVTLLAVRLGLRIGVLRSAKDIAHCPTCGYAREGLVSDRCPECGSLTVG